MIDPTNATNRTDSTNPAPNEGAASGIGSSRLPAEGSPQPDSNSSRTTELSHNEEFTNPVWIDEEADVEIYPDSVASQFIAGQAFCDTRTGERERIAASFRKQRKSGRRCAVPDQVHLTVLTVAPHEIRVISKEDPNPKMIKVTILEAAGYLRSGEWRPIDSDPHAAINLANLSPHLRERCKKLMALIEPIIALGVDQFDEKKRWAAIKAMGPGVDVKQVYRVLYRYWQGGMRPTAVLGRWWGRRRRRGRGARLITVAEARRGVEKVAIGRPRADGKAMFRCGEEDRKRIIAAGKEWYWTLNGGCITRAWLLMVARDYLPDLHGLGPEEIERRLEEFPPSEYPSKRAFSYYLETDKYYIRRVKSRIGERAFNLTHRPLSKKTEDGAYGPGSHFQIDATILDVMEVHRSTRMPIGRPVVYLVADCFSHMIVGYAITLEHAGFDSASIALLCTGSDKVAVCAKAGIEITAKQWPVACLPDILIADSELASLKAHGLVVRGAVEGVRIAPAYRADLKGLIERKIGSLTQTTVSHLPGYTKGHYERAKERAEVTATIDHADLTEIVIHSILQANKKVIRSYNKTAAMEADPNFPAPTPLNLWNWGLDNELGLRKKWDPALLMQLCLHPKQAQMTRYGLECEGVTYIPAPNQLPDFESWQVEVIARGPWSEQIITHPADVNEAWLLHEGRFVRLQRLNSQREAHEGWSWFDHDHARVVTTAVKSGEEAKTTPTLAFHELEKLKAAQCSSRKTVSARGTARERRRQKFDKTESREDERQKLKGQQDSTPGKTSPRNTDIFAEDDE